MRVATLVVLIFASIGFLGSCNKKINNPLSDPLPAIRNTVFTAKTPNGESVSSPIEGNMSNETPPRYEARHEFGNLGIEVGFQYIGKGIVNIKDKVDVYLISYKIGDKPAQYEAVFYEGGNKVLVERPEIVISFTQDNANNRIR
jgi:hypothetical protein